MDPNRRDWILIVLALIAVAFLMLLPWTAHGKTTVEFKLLPPGVLGVVDGHYYRLYTLEEFKELAKFDAELEMLRLDIDDHLATISEQKKVIDAQKVKIWTLEKDKDILANRSKRLDDALDKCEREKTDLAGGPIWPYVVAAVGGAVGIAGFTAWAVSR